LHRSAPAFRPTVPIPSPIDEDIRMLITQAAWARRHGFARQYVTQLARKGIVRLVEGKINPGQADAALAAIRDPARAERRAGREDRSPAPANPAAQEVHGSGVPAAAGDLPTLFLKTRIKSEAERAKLLELKAKVEAGKYVDVDEVRVAAFNKARTVRGSLLNIPGRLAPLLAAESDERECFRLIDAEIRQALVELTGGPKDD